MQYIYIFFLIKYVHFLELNFQFSSVPVALSLYLGKFSLAPRIKMKS